MTDNMTQLADRRMVLATDLDGTFLGGSDADRDHLYEWVEQNRRTIGLIFVTGRDPKFIQDLCGAGRIPWPDYVVGDVGTTIAHVDPSTGLTPIASLEADITAAWNDLGPKVRAKLDGHAGLRLQPTEFRYRVSYYMQPDEFDDSAVQIVESLGADVLISDNLYFDVLPRGISKGPSLLRLIDHLGVDASRVLAAGDTLNDLSMLIAGTPAVAVGGSEADLLRALPPSDRIHRAKAIGAAGILEAISAFDLHPTPKKV